MNTPPTMDDLKEQAEIEEALNTPPEKRSERQHYLVAQSVAKDANEKHDPSTGQFASGGGGGGASKGGSLQSKHQPAGVASGDPEILLKNKTYQKAQEKGGGTFKPKIGPSGKKSTWTAGGDPKYGLSKEGRWDPKP